MAPEFWEKSMFTLSSDVWSYGVVIWEIFSLGKEPYCGKSFGEVTEGMEVVDKIVNLPRDGNDCPKQEAKMLEVTISE